MAVNLKTVRPGTFLKSDDGYYYVVDNSNINKSIDMYYIDLDIIRTYSNDQGDRFFKMSKQEASVNGVSHLVDQYKNRQRAKQQEEERKRLPGLFAQMKELLKKTNKDFTLDLDSNGNPTIKFDQYESGYDHEFSFSSETWEIESVIGQLQDILADQEAKISRQVYLQGWWDALSPEDKQNFREIRENWYKFTLNK